MSDLTKRLRKWQYEYEITDFGDAADRIEALEECVRESARSLDGIAKWRDGALAYDADVGNQPRSFCEDIELVEQSAKYAADKARALLEE